MAQQRIQMIQNPDSLGRSGLIPFSKELEHTRLYTDIEMVRITAQPGRCITRLSVQTAAAASIPGGARVPRSVTSARKTSRTLELESTTGSGTTMTMHIPAEEAAL